ncbi:MAG: InlB B-repeat-containing protein, partial [Anaerococcus sp.]|nr:InlB B-repeat-containing protein [Anaerococcus sp.]
MKNKKPSILVAALSISFILTSQSSYAQDMPVNTTEVEQVEKTAQGEQAQKDSTSSTKDEKNVDSKGNEEKSPNTGEVTEPDGSNKDQKAEPAPEKETIPSDKKSEEIHFTNEQKEKLRKAGFSEENIEKLEISARSEKIEAEKANKEFDLDAFIENAIKAQKPVGNEKESKPKNSEEEKLDISEKEEKTGVTAPNPGEVDAISSATYYNKANWENKIKDKSRWKVEDSQRLVRVSGSDPIGMNDVDYDGMFIDANGRYVIRLLYKEKSTIASGVWYRALFNFGDLDQFIDYDNSYVVGKDEKRYSLDKFDGGAGRILDTGRSVSPRTDNRTNLPINLVLKEGVDLNTLGSKNYIVQMRVTDTKGEKIYAYAPGKTSMDYSTYTKTTSVSLDDKVNNLFMKGGFQKNSENATYQEFFMSEFIANPENYSDKSNLGIIRTQYTGERSGGAKSPTVEGQPIAFTQAFDANLVNYLKADAQGNIAYVTVLTNARVESPYAHRFGIPKEKINYSKDGKLAYLVIAPSYFTKEGVNVVNVDTHDQYTMLNGIYITAIDYVVDKSKFENTFSQDKTRKLDYSMISGWTNPNKDGWTIFEKVYDNEYVVPEGESYLIDTTSVPEGKQIMIRIGDDQAIIRRGQGYYNGLSTGKGAIEKITEYAKGVYEFTLREGATLKAGQKLRVYMPYTSDHNEPVNFLEMHNGTKLDQGAATLKLQKDRNINMHLYTDLPRGATFKLKYTLKGQKDEKTLVFTKPKAGTFWQYNDSDKVITGIPNKSILSSGGNFWINTKVLEPGKDIIVEAYDENGNEIKDRKSWFKYVDIPKSGEKYTDLTWTDHSDKSSILSINKSLYTPYQVIFTNDYADGTNDFYKDPRAFTGTNEDFMKDTKEFVGYTKYEGGKIRTLYDGKDGRLYAKVEADSNEYDDKGNLVGGDKSKMITIPKSDIFDAQFEGENKEYKAYEYTVNLREMLLYHSNIKDKQSLTLLKDMKFITTASDGSSLPSDLYETRVRARVLFDANTGKFADGKDKEVKIAPDNVNFLDQEDYKANGFIGANVKAGTGDEFAEAPILEGKNFLGWVTEAGKTALGNKAVVTADEFNKLPKEQIFTNETPITKHLVVYAVYSDEVTVTFDANQGTFTDGKDTTNVKVEGGKVTKPADPTRDGFTFKGWAADNKDATEANVTDFTGITAPKTYYAVWDRTDKTPLTLKDPEKTVVKDITSLTEPEQEKVEAAVIKANPDLNLTPADVVVDDDGTVKVTKDGKTGKIAPEKTVEQEKVQNNFNPPKEPVKVVDKTKLTPEEKQAVKDAIKAANPDRNFTDDDITVNDDGSVNINQGGKVSSFTPDQTVVQKDTLLKLEDPVLTEVKDPKNLTQEERDAVKAAVIASNTGLNLSRDDITVDSKGNVTVKTSDGKTGEIPDEKTVKEKVYDLSKLNNPTITKVADDKLLVENEKQAVKDAIKAANKEFELTDDEITVEDNGRTTVTRGESSKTFEPRQTVKKDATLLDVKAPQKTEVVNINDLTEKEQEAVEAAIIEVNPGLKLTKEEVKINDDGSAEITRDGKTYILGQADNVVEKLKAPKLEALKDGGVLITPTDDRADKLEITIGDKSNPQSLTATRDNNGKWTLPEGTDPSIRISETTGEVYIRSDKLNNVKEVKAVSKDGDKASNEAKVNPKDTIAPSSPKVEANDDGRVTVTPPTDKDTKSVEVTYTDNDGNKKTVTATKGDDGKWSVPEGSDVTVDPNTGVITVPADKVKDGTEVSAKAKDEAGNASTAGTAKTPTTADQTDPTVPAKTPVANTADLTQEEKDAVKKKV